MNAEHYHYLFKHSTSDGFTSTDARSFHAVAIVRHRHEVTDYEMEAENPQAHNHTFKTGGPYFPTRDPIDGFLTIIDIDEAP